MSVPQTKICICKEVRLNSSYKHSIYFADKAAQENYFSGKVVKTFTAYSFIRRHWNLKVEATRAEAEGWTYLYFNNYANGKIYYYFINDVEYVNDSTVELKLELDVLQTYAFDMVLKPCFIERQHTESDAIGDNTVPENLDVGDYTNITNIDVDLNDLCILVLSTFEPGQTTKDKTENVFASNYNSIFCGMGVYAIDLSDWEAWGEKLRQLSEWGKIDGIVTMFMYPKKLVTLAGDYTWDDGYVGKPVVSATAYELTTTPVTTKIDGYTPKNKKLFTYPYNFLYVTNNAGGAAMYKYESFYGETPITFKIYGAYTPDGSVKMSPLKYKGATNHFDESITLSGFPTCAWNADAYKIWLAQNQNSQNFSMITSGLTIAAGVAGIATGNVLAGVGGVAAGAAHIGNILAAREDKAIQPPQARGSYSASVNIAANRQTFTIYKRCIKAEYARIIDDYFTMYGYRINRVQTPNINARSSFTYVKTVGAVVIGNIINADIKSIETIFDNGVTYWKNGDKISDYTLENSPI